MVSLTGKENAIYIREEYQDALDCTHKEVENKIHWLYKMNHKLKYYLSQIQKYKKDIVSCEEERKSSYETLINILESETNFEGKMWGITQKGEHTTNIRIKQKFKDSDIDEIKFNSANSYLKKYPKYASRPSFKNLQYRIIGVEKRIRETKKKYNYAISKTLRELAYWPRNIIQAEDLVKRFKEQFKEGNEKLKSMRYLNSIFYKFSSEKEKTKVNIHTLYYRMDGMENTINKLKEESEKAKKIDLEVLEY